MFPQTQQQTGAPKTTSAGVLSIILGALGLFTHIWGAVHGQQLDPQGVITSVGMIGAGAGLVAAADQKK